MSVFTPVTAGADGLVGTLPLVDGGPAAVTFPLAPFLGTMGVAVAGEDRPHSVPPGAHGGNIDIKLLTEGSVLYLPVQVPGALAYVGDPHFAQGDGEVALTALEASLRATLRFDVVPRAEALAEFGEVLGPLVRTDEYLVPTGLDPAPPVCRPVATRLPGEAWEEVAVVDGDEGRRLRVRALFHPHGVVGRAAARRKKRG